MSAARRRTNYGAAMDRREPGTPPAGATTIRTKPVRITIDLIPALHEEIKDWTRQTAASVDRDVRLAEVGRALFRRLLNDPDLARDIKAQLSDQEK